MTEGLRGPEYRRIVDAIRERIGSGKLAVGDALPSLAQIRIEFGVTEGIARRALVALREEGLVTTHMGKGSYVRAAPEEPVDLTDAMRAVGGVQEEIRRLGQRVDQLEAQLQQLRDDRSAHPAATPRRPDRRPAP